MLAKFLILGATGDLAGRYLFPALADLRRQSDPAIAGPIVGVGQEDWDTPRFREEIARKFEAHARHLPEEALRAVLDTLEYHRADVTDPAQIARILGDETGPVAVYLALPPSVSAAVIGALVSARLPEGSRIVVEKPFGRDLASARALNDLIRPAFPESSVFRIDHFLGKQTVQNVLGLRFANRIFESLWNRDHIERVEILCHETVALEGRAGYYDKSGALRDMVQNHLLQLLCLVAMEPPVAFNERDFRDRKVDVLRAVRRYRPEEVAAETVRARYSAGRVGDRAIPDYAAEPGVDPSLGTETFAQIALKIDNWRWAGVPFLLRTGKAMREARQEIVVHFRPVPHLAFEQAAPPPNRLRFRINPDRMELGVNINGAGDPFDLERICLDADLAPQAISAYGRLLLDILAGDATLSIRGDEAEEAWRIVEPILAGWADGVAPLLEYPAGSDGPVPDPSLD